MKTAHIALLAYVWFINIGPPFLFGLFYVLYYADAMGNDSDLHCVVDITKAGKMEQAIPLDYMGARLHLKTNELPDFLEKNPEYTDMTESYRGMMLFGMIV